MKFRRQEVEPLETQEILPQVLLKSLQSLESESLIVIPGEQILFQSPGISNFAILKDERIISEDLMALIRVARRTNETHRSRIEIARGPIGAGKREFEVSVSPLNDEGMVLVLISDQSEAKRIDAVRRDFVANVSHELKTPIGALGLLSEAILGAKDQPDAVVKFASRMQIEAKRLTDLVQEIIDLSRLQSSDPLQKAFDVEASDVVREAVTQAALSAESRSISVEIGEIEDATVIGDRDQLIMAVLNLVENAINYSPENTKVSVVAKVKDQLLEISVTDQGIGIAEGELARVFERFYRVDPARSRMTGGTGLGLSIVKHVALNHGGDIKVWSKEGVGSTFTLQLPITQTVRGVSS
ncbi:MAG: histidine kinase [Actinobacteria bacterium]|nr:histidine kinase [Actinomycetota bacterium]NBO47660.1 histidine kinase [Actinomycetota bacterium]NBP12264.1 histidine kinase [Actinomycetota bacterium]NBP22601.1 histidine kinase [Actinomycetota bacterium]NBP43226.1 histidine kinase [Actinomycetota bacterium]